MGDLLKPAPLFAQEAVAQGLKYQFMSQGFNHQSALVIGLHNANHDSSITVDLPAGMLLAPAENRDLQNLVLKDAVHMTLLPGETKRVEQWAFCGNQYHVPPVSEEMKPTGWTLDAPPELHLEGHSSVRDGGHCDRGQLDGRQVRFSA